MKSDSYKKEEEEEEEGEHLVVYDKRYEKVRWLRKYLAKK